MSTGKINVAVENIFPLIKKFLYSDHEIFLRELISNATDATTKLQHLSSLGEIKGDLGDLTIEVKVDKKAKKIHIIDKGVGMSQEEVQKYINEVAFSGAEEFLEQYKDSAKDSGIIGHFGLGFYSAFMVADKVEIKILQTKTISTPNSNITTFRIIAKVKKDGLVKKEMKVTVVRKVMTEN